ncbi:MAG: ubiquinol-cytochrome c reductase iron-sulfur subunit [Nitrospirota bacterium]
MSKQQGGGEEGGAHTQVGTRRTFFGWVTKVAAGLIGLGLAIPLAGYVISPALKRRARPWVDVGSLEDVPFGDPKQLDHVTTIQDGYLKSQSQKAVWAVKQPDGQVRVFSPMCTHLGCGYRWDGEEKQFKCPCHGSVFDIEGKVVAGPAPRPLDLLPSKIENGRLLVVFKEFKPGTREVVEF